MTEMITHARILGTGGAGFIGSNLVEKLLRQDNEVVCLDNFLTGKRENIEPFRNNPHFRLVEGDIRSIADCRRAADGADYVLHEAALGSVPRSIADPMTSTDINISGFVNMLWAAKEAGVKRFVYAASSSVYGDSRELPKVEERIGKPLSPYAITKYVNELYAANFSALYGMETIGLRYFNVYGRRQDPSGAYAAVIPKFLKLLLSGQAPTINGDGKQSRDFTYIDNVIEANLKACQAGSEAAGQAYNIGSGGRVFLIDLYRGLCDALGVSIEPVFGPPRKGDIRDSNADISKARKLLGYDPDYDFEKGIALAIDWYKENL